MAVLARKILSWRLGFPMSVRDLAGAMCDMQPRGTPEDHQTEGPPYNATTVIAPRRETHPWRRLTFCVAAALDAETRLFRSPVYPRASGVRQPRRGDLGSAYPRMRVISYFVRERISL